MTIGTENSHHHFLMVGTAPPTRCGLASYTNNLANAMTQGGHDISILRLLDENDSLTNEPSRVTQHWNRRSDGDIRAAADHANRHDGVLLQHEFGIYPGDDGVRVIELLERVEVPTISVLHTILSEPSSRHRRIIEEISDASSAVIVHSTTAQERLVDVYDIDPAHVHMIVHGAVSRIGLSKPLTRSAPSILTWGLIGPGKGIEHGIAAIARLRRLGIDVEYVVSGATHPNVLAAGGDRYRYELLTLSRQLGVEDLVRFDGHYRSREEQDQIIGAASIVLLPYDNHDQVTSGVLVEALAAGKPVIATRFPHALELAPSGGIEIVGHRCPDQIAEAILSIIEDPEHYDEMRSAAWMEGLRHDWSLVGPKFSRVLQQAVAHSNALEAPRRLAPLVEFGTQDGLEADTLPRKKAAVA